MNELGWRDIAVAFGTILASVGGWLGIRATNQLEAKVSKDEFDEHVAAIENRFQRHMDSDERNLEKVFNELSKIGETLTNTRIMIAGALSELRDSRRSQDHQDPQR